MKLRWRGLRVLVLNVFIGNVIVKAKEGFYICSSHHIKLRQTTTKRVEHQTSDGDIGIRLAIDMMELPSQSE